jgi:hypothetical protein
MSERLTTITDGQREIVRQALVELNAGVEPTHWGNTDFGRIMGAVIWMATVGAILIGILFTLGN